METLPRLLRRLGEGGMGEVWLAEDARRGIVAVKQLRAEFSGSEGLARFRAEFAALARLRHANLVEAYDYIDFPDGRQGYSMQYVQGLDFTASTGGLAFTEVMKLAEQVCEALEHVHSNDLIHGDIKPGNLIVSSGAVKLMDFGLAERPGPRGVRGSLDYLAPEVIQGRPRDRRADLYAFGAVLFEALTRQTPFAGNSRFALLRAHLRSQAEFPDRSLAAIPEPVRRVILRLLCKDPSARYFTAAETAEALRSARGAAGRRDLRPEAIGRSGAMAGRDRHLEELEGALRRASSGAGPEVQVVEGPAGSGKSALMRAFAARLGERHVAHAWATGAPGASPLAGVRDWIASLAAHATAEWPRLRSALAAIDAGSATAPEAAAGALEAAARRAPLVLLFSSAEWADAASLDVVARLRLRPRARLLVAAATTPLEGTATWDAPRIELGPVTVAEAAEIAKQSTGATGVDPEFSRALHGAAGGNPGGVRACLRALAAGNALFVLDGTLRASAPPSSGPGLERAVAFLGTDARITAEALAVLGRLAPARDVAAIAGLPPDRVALALFDLERRGLAARESGPLGERIRFAAPAIAPALLASAQPDSLRSMHRAAALVAREAGLPGPAARHLFASGGGPEAVAAGIEAARHAAGPAPETAVAFLESVLADPACSGSESHSARALLADCRARCGDSASAATLFLELAASSAPAERDAFRLRAAQLLAATEPASSLSIAEPLPPSAARSSTRAAALAALGRFPESLLEAREARDLAAEARALLALGRFASAFDVALAAATEAERTGRPELAASAALIAAEAAFERDDPGGAAAAAAIASSSPG
ncbi:MAG: serine/threonine-protein kinase PknK, partial [Planctomycetes bacterium]|nr:serine/threonine-protein kinase PknK [Planctomycetota bacterium]